MPHAVHDAAPGQRIRGVGEPVGQGRAARGFVFRLGQVKAGRQRDDRGQRARRNFGPRFGQVTAFQKPNEAGLRQCDQSTILRGRRARRRPDRDRRRQGSQRRLRPLPQKIGGQSQPVVRRPLARRLGQNHFHPGRQRP